MFGDHPRRRLVRMNGLEVRRRLEEGELEAVFLSEAPPPPADLPVRTLAPGFYLAFPSR